MNKKIYLKYKAETTISHRADESMKTTSLVRTNNVIIDGKRYKVPNISAASIRTRLIRQPATNRLLDLLELDAKDLPILSHTVLYSGGGRLESAETHMPLQYIRTVRQYFPLLACLGATTNFCMLEGDFKVTSANALLKDIVKSNCFEIEDTIIKKFNIDTENLSNIVTEFQFNTKRDSRLNVDENDKTIANIFDQQLLIKGTLLGNLILIRDYDELKGSFLNSSLINWKKEGGFIGGQSSQGSGILSYQLSENLPKPEIYENFVIENKDLIIKLLMEEKIWKDKKVISSLLK